MKSDIDLVKKFYCTFCRAFEMNVTEISRGHANWSNESIEKLRFQNIDIFALICSSCSTC